MKLKTGKIIDANQGVYYDFSNFFMREDKQNEFKGFFGRYVFEPYVFRILLEHFNENETFHGEDIDVSAGAGVAVDAAGIRRAVRKIRLPG